MEEEKKVNTKSNNSINILVIIVAIVAIIGTIYYMIPKTQTIKYSEYDYIKDKVNDYNGFYSVGSGNYGSGMLIVEDPTNLILMVTNPNYSNKRVDIAMIDFTNMRIRNTQYDLNNNPIMITEMDIDRDYNISSATTYLYSADRTRTYSRYDNEWSLIQSLAKNIGSGVDAIIKGNDGIGVDVYYKTIQTLKNTEYKY